MRADHYVFAVAFQEVLLDEVQPKTRRILATWITSGCGREAEECPKSVFFALRAAKTRPSLVLGRPRSVEIWVSFLKVAKLRLEAAPL
jgi:hypothetical protein